MSYTPSPFPPLSPSLPPLSSPHPPPSHTPPTRPPTCLALRLHQLFRRRAHLFLSLLFLLSVFCFSILLSTETLREQQQQRRLPAWDFSFPFWSIKLNAIYAENDANTASFYSSGSSTSSSSSLSSSSREALRKSFHTAHAAIVDHVNEESRGANWSAKIYPRFAEKEFDPWSLLGSLPGEMRMRRSEKKFVRADTARP